MMSARPPALFHRWLTCIPALYAAIALAASSGTLRAQLAPLPHDRGASGLALALRRLPVTGRVLYVTAHPDDEHNGVLVMLSRGRGVRTGLLTLTRGEGGQNEIGPELFDALGVLRTEELAALHRYDGVEQFFGRAYEFGYSFSVEETFRKWGREETLGDVVRAVRAFRPDVILTLPLEAEGGGQHHQAAAQLARDAFRAAADPLRFPEHLQAGLRPWQASKIYQGSAGETGEKLAGAPPVVLKTGVFDPVLGMTWQELGSLARALHKCQGASQLKASPNAGEGAYVLVDSEPRVTAREADLFDRIDVTLKRLLRFAPGEEAKVPFLGPELEALQREIDGAQSAFQPADPGRSRPFLARALDLVRKIRDRVKESALGEAAKYELVERLARKELEVLDALALAERVVFEVLADDDGVVPGQTFAVTARVWNQSDRPLAVEGLELSVPDGWTAQRTAHDREVNREREGRPGSTPGVPDEPGPRVLDPRGTLTAKYSVRVSETARLSQPYWRRRPGADRHDLEVPQDEGLPWSPPPVAATLRYSSSGVVASLTSPAIWRYEGRWVGGEKQKVVNVVPALSVRVSPEIAVVPVSGKRVRKEFRVSVVNGAKEGGAATVRLEAPPGWSIEPREAVLEFHYEGQEATARFFVTPPARLEPGDVEVRTVAVRGDHEFREGLQVVAYDHIQERHLVLPAAVRVKVLDVSAAPGTSVGYVMGAGDEVAAAIDQLGVPVTFLRTDDLAYGDLSRFTTIVTGVRAYQVRQDLKSSHHRVLKYVEEGGNLVVQYNKFEFNVLSEPPRAGGFAYQTPTKEDSPFAPYGAGVSSTRVTDETAPVEILVPGHPLFTRPNRIGPADWAGWVQERGLYFLDTRDPRYVELVASADSFPKNPGRKKGALVEARVGKGTWTYVGLGLFRQLPAGTPGAYRLLANLVGRPRGR